MTVPVIQGFDVTHQNIEHAPAPNSGLQAALYLTGTSDIMATGPDLAKYPNALRIAQWPVIATDEIAIPDFFDAEARAITVEMLPALVSNAITHYHAGTRPGQRWPAIYCGDQANPTEVANALDAAGLGNQSVGLIIVNWSLTLDQATQMVANSVPGNNNPYPVVGVQYSDHGPNGEPYDRYVFSRDWVNTVSESTAPVQPTPPPAKPTLLGIVCYIQEGFRAVPTDFVSKRVESTDGGNTWH